MNLADKTFMAAIVAILIASCQGCGTFPPDPECGYLRNSANQNVKAKIPVYFYLDDSVPLSYREAILQASEDWNDSTGLKLFEFVGMVNSDTGWQTYDGLMTVYWVTGRYVRSSSEEAFTHSKWNGNIIAESDIWVNNVNFNYYTDDNPYAGQVHLRSLMIHEFGHMLGLTHNKNPKSAMYLNLANRTVRPIIDEDVQNIFCEYRSQQ